MWFVYLEVFRLEKIFRKMHVPRKNVLGECRHSEWGYTCTGDASTVKERIRNVSERAVCRAVARDESKETLPARRRGTAWISTAVSPCRRGLRVSSTKTCVGDFFIREKIMLKRTGKPSETELLFRTRAVFSLFAATRSTRIRRV